MSSNSAILQPGGLRPGLAQDFADRVTRGRLFAGLFLVGFASASTERLISSVNSRGLADSLMTTFDVSAIVWGSVVAGLFLLLQLPDRMPRALDLAVAGLAVLLFLVPFTVFSWLGVTALAGYVILSSDRRSTTSRGAWIFFAVAVSMFWSPKLFETFSPTILSADAELVSRITGTERIGNTVRMVNGQGFIWVAPGCSSMANMSLAFLCWVTFGKFWGTVLKPFDFLWCALAAGAVVGLNVLRIAIIALRPDLYDLVHGPIGTAVAGYLTLAVIVGVCVAWKRHEIFPRV